MPKIIIDRDVCKGCGLCVTVCPKKALMIAKTLNAKGYFAVEHADSIPCTACGTCMIVCPEMALETDDEKDEKEEKSDIDD
jgi:2-oxoglutarate ferredoxin oxidoreductase subunit delta